MKAPAAIPPKPVTKHVRTEITRLPELTAGRLRTRRLLRSIVRLIIRLFTRVEIQGMENVPRAGPVLAVSNHLGDADMLVGIAFSVRPMEILAKADLYDLPLLGRVMEAYGVIWIHRGQADRRAIRTAMEALQEGRLVVIAPEGRESVTGSLEPGTSGAAYLALKAGVPVLPVTLTGTENRRLINNMRRFIRTSIAMTVGPPFRLDSSGDWRADIDQGTEIIMQTLAAQLPAEYRGVYE